MSDAVQAGPDTHQMDAPSDVTAWTVIPTTRNVVAADGRGMTLRDEWWTIPTLVVDAIDAQALVHAQDTLTSDAVRDALVVLPPPPDMKAYSEIVTTRLRALLGAGAPTIGDWQPCTNPDCPSAHVAHEHDSRGWYRGPEARPFA